MSVLPVLDNPQDPQIDIPKPTLSTALCGSLMTGALTAAAAVIFTPIPALGGAIFGATSHFSGHLINVLLDKVGCSPDSGLGKVLKWAVSFFASIAIAAAVTTMVGIPITFTSGLILTGAALVTSCLATCAFIGAVTCCGCALATAGSRS